MDSSILLHTLKLRIRSNAMGYLKLSSSPAEQREYERRISIAQALNEVINQ